MRVDETENEMRKGAPEEDCNPVQILTGQHREVETLFAELEEIMANKGKGREKDQLFETLAEKITLHAKLEEKHVYPGLKEIDEQKMFEALEEHEAVKTLISKIRRTKSSDETFPARVKFLKELIEHHVKEEEEELLPMWEASKAPEEIAAIGEKIEKLVAKSESQKPERTSTSRSRPSTSVSEAHL